MPAGFQNRIRSAILAGLILLGLICLPMISIRQEVSAEAAGRYFAVDFVISLFRGECRTVPSVLFSVFMLLALLAPVLTLAGALAQKRKWSVAGGFVGTMVPLLLLAVVILEGHIGYVFAAKKSVVCIGLWLNWALSIADYIVSYVDRSERRKGRAVDAAIYVLLASMCVLWLLPFFWLVMQSFRDGKGQFIDTFLPTKYTMNNYKALFTEFNVMNFPRMFFNTLFIACCSCVISTFFVLSVSYCTSRLKWKMRKPYMNMAMILNLFPGFMSMVAVYFILKALGMTEGNKIPLALIIVFSAGAGTGFYVMKGYMDTIPKVLDEAAAIDGCTRWQIFTKITLPLSKPMIVYQVITSFMAPWVDFIFAKVIVRTEAKYFTVSIGLWSMLEKEYVDTWFVRFCAGAVLVSIPIAILFMVTQKFYQEAMSGSVKG